MPRAITERCTGCAAIDHAPSSIIERCRLVITGRPQDVDADGTWLISGTVPPSGGLRAQLPARCSGNLNVVLTCFGSALIALRVSVRAPRGEPSPGTRQITHRMIRLRARAESDGGGVHVQGMPRDPGRNYSRGASPDATRTTASFSRPPTRLINSEPCSPNRPGATASGSRGSRPRQRNAASQTPRPTVRHFC